MTIYATGNALGSTDPRDLLDNAQNFDNAVNDVVNDTWVDRFGVTRKTLKGYDFEFETDQATRQQIFDDFIESSGYDVLGEYVAGLVITARNQVFAKDGELYKVKTNTALPYTLTGVWADESFRFVSVGDAALRQQLAEPGGASLVFTKSLIASAFAKLRPVSERLADIVSANDYLVGDGVADDSVACQALIDALSAQGAGCIIFPRNKYKLNVIERKGVSFVGASGGASRGMGVSSSTVNRWMTTFIAAAPGWIVDTVQETSYGIGINGIDFQGGGLAMPGGGVRIRPGNNAPIVRACLFNNFADEGLYADSLIGRYSDLATTNCLLSRTRSAETGTIRIEGADNFVERVQGNAGITGIVSANLYLGGIYIGGANNYCSHLEGELSEVGIITRATGAAHKLTACRADLNFGPGFVGTAMYSNCHSLNNSNGTSGTYDGFVTEGASAQYDGCRAVGAHRYGLNASAADFTALSQRPNVDNFVSSGHITGEINYPANNGIVVGLRGAHLRNISAAGDISVAGGVNSIRFNHGADAGITGLTGEHLGQMVTLTAGTANTILTRSAGFVVHGVDGLGKKRLQLGRAYTFVRGQTGWVETSDNSVTPIVSTRPNLYAVPGMTVIDSVLGRPIWRNAANTGWIDATGATV